MSEIIFDWMDFYQAFANRLLDFKNNREELIVKFKKIYDDADIKWSCLEKDFEGNFIDPVDIDPFTVVGVFNRNMTDENRFKIIKSVKDEFSISEELPTGFHGIPRIRSDSPRFYAYEYKGRQEDDIDNLWEVFEAAINYSSNPKNEQYRKEFIKWFNKVKDQKGVGLSYFTTGLFWIRPYIFINLDSRNLKFIVDSHLFSDDLVNEVKSIKKGFPTGELYLKICEECTLVIENSDYEHLVDFSYNAFLNDVKGETDYIGKGISLKKDFQKVLDEYLDAKKRIGTTRASIAHYITKDIPEHINELLGNDRYSCGSSAGKGNLAEIPRIAFGINNKINKNDVDVAYLFKSDMNGVYLVLRTFYNMDIGGKYGNYLPEYLKTNSKHIRDFIKVYGFETDDYLESIELLSNSSTAQLHTAGTIYSKFYEKSNILSDDVLEKDLFEFLEMFEIVLDNYSDNMYLTVDEWINALEDENLVDSRMLNVLEIIYDSENHTACFDDIAKERHKLGFINEKPMTYNSPIIYTSKRLKQHFNKTALYNKDDEEEYWSRLFYGGYKKHEDGRRLFYFTIRDELIEALEKYDKSKRDDLEEEIMTNENHYDSFNEFLLDKGFYFNKETIENYLLSLKVKPFVILTGNSGTGKTKLSQLFAQYLNQKDNYKIIPVGANWTENRHILGFYNILENKAQFTPAYYLIEKSQEHSYPHFLILDEMNLSHVERYFADFLSAIESNENIPLHGENELEIPNNLFIVGTVNVDETTYMFSPKVLDRANTIEFETYSAKDYMTNKFDISEPKGNIDYLEDLLINQDIQEMSIQELEKIFSDDGFWQELSDEIFKFQKILKESGFDFGFRVINEIVRFMAIAYKYENEPEIWTNWKRYFDAQIKQKMLPKLHGSQKIIGETLDKLLEACEDYPTSKTKLEEMINVLEKQRYVSFIN